MGLTSHSMGFDDRLHCTCWHRSAKKPERCEFQWDFATWHPKNPWNTTKVLGLFCISELGRIGHWKGLWGENRVQDDYANLKPSNLQKTECLNPALEKMSFLYTPRYHCSHYPGHNTFARPFPHLRQIDLCSKQLNRLNSNKETYPRQADQICLRYRL